MVQVVDQESVCPRRCHGEADDGERERDPAAVILSFFVPGKPVPKGRHRSRVVNPASGKAYAINYTDRKTAVYENLVALGASNAMQLAGVNQPLSGPLMLDIEIRKPIPSSWSKKRRERARAGLDRPLTKPDGSNIQKAVEDGMNGVVYQDDKQIVEWAGRSVYSDTPGVWVRVSSYAL